MTRETASNILHDMYFALNRAGDLRIAINRDMSYASTIDFSKGVHKICLNPSDDHGGGIVVSGLHEMLHYLHEDADEDTIERMAFDMYQVLTDRQLSNFMKMLCNRM